MASLPSTQWSAGTPNAGHPIHEPKLRLKTRFRAQKSRYREYILGQINEAAGWVVVQSSPLIATQIREAKNSQTCKTTTTTNTTTATRASHLDAPKKNSPFLVPTVYSTISTYVTSATGS